MQSTYLSSYESVSWATYHTPLRISRWYSHMMAWSILFACTSSESRCSCLKWFKFSCKKLPSWKPDIYVVCDVVDVLSCVSEYDRHFAFPLRPLATWFLYTHLCHNLNLPFLLQQFLVMCPNSRRKDVLNDIDLIQPTSLLSAPMAFSPPLVRDFVEV